MSVIKDLDKWAYDIEQQFKVFGEVDFRTKKKYGRICAIRDRLHYEYCRKHYIYDDPDLAVWGCRERINKTSAFFHPKGGTGETNGGYIQNEITNNPPLPPGPPGSTNIKFVKEEPPRLPEPPENRTVWR